MPVIAHDLDAVSVLIFETIDADLALIVRSIIDTLLVDALANAIDCFLTNWALYLWLGLDDADIGFDFIAKFALLADTSTADEVGAVGNKVHAFFAKEVLIVSTSRSVNVAQLSSIVIGDQIKARGAPMTSSSKLLEVDAVVKSVITAAKGIVLVRSTLGVLHADTDSVWHPPSEASLAPTQNIIETDAGEP